MEALLRIGLVEDHDYLREVLEQMIRLCGYDTGSFDSAEAFLTAAGEFDWVAGSLFEDE